jgi:hypothetical protein
MSDFDHPERITTKELVEMIRGYSIGLRASGNIAGSLIVRIAADRLEELEEKLHGISD